MTYPAGMDDHGMTPAAPGFDAKRLKRLESLVRDHFVGSGMVPHAQLLLSRDERIVLDLSCGAAREDGAPLACDALFRIASMTKPVTSVAFMMLVEQGLTALDAPVHRVIPELRGVRVRSGGGIGGAPFETERTRTPMRMIDLLRHTAGFTYSFQRQGPIDAAYGAAKLDDFHQDRSAGDFIAALAALPLEFHPGTSWNYSVATDVLGVVVERLSGQGLPDYFRDHIFAPLGMQDSFFTVPAEKLPRLTDAWMLDTKGGRSLFDTAARSRWAKSAGFACGGAGLVSSTQDYHRFCRMLLRGGELDGARLLSPKTVALMTQNHLPGRADLASLSTSMFSESQNSGIGFGLGFAVTQDPAAAMIAGTPGEYYWGGMFSTFFFVDPVERLIAIFMTQVMPSSAVQVRRELKTAIYAALTESRA